MLTRNRVIHVHLPFFNICTAISDAYKYGCASSVRHDSSTEWLQSSQMSRLNDFKNNDYSDYCFVVFFFNTVEAAIVACVASVSARVRRESWDKSKKKALPFAQ